MTVSLAIFSLQYCAKLFTIKITNPENYLVSITIEVSMVSTPEFLWEPTDFGIDFSTKKWTKVIFWWN